MAKNPTLKTISKVTEFFDETDIACSKTFVASELGLFYPTASACIDYLVGLGKITELNTSNGLKYKKLDN